MAQWWSSKLRRRSSSVRNSLNSLPKCKPSEFELLSSLVLVVSVFDVFDSLVSFSFALLSTDSPCDFCKLVGVTNSRSNAFGKASPSRSLLEHTLSWSSQPSTDPTPNSGNVSSYKTKTTRFTHEKSIQQIREMSFDVIYWRLLLLIRNLCPVNEMRRCLCMVVALDSKFPLFPLYCKKINTMMILTKPHIVVVLDGKIITYFESPPATRIWAMSWKMAALTTNSMGAMTP